MGAGAARGHATAAATAGRAATRAGAGLGTGELVRPLPAGDAMLTEAETEDFEERAAILEYEAGFPRAEAEQMARQMVIDARRVE